MLSSVPLSATPRLKLAQREGPDHLLEHRDQAAKVRIQAHHRAYSRNEEQSLEGEHVKGYVDSFVAVFEKSKNSSNKKCGTGENDAHVPQRPEVRLVEK